jgi:hypothetical protein
MPSFTSDKFSNFYKRILQIGNSDNSGTPTTLTNIQAGDGTATCVDISDDSILIRPKDDNTTATLTVRNAGGDQILNVDTTNKKVLVGSEQVATNTNYAVFSINGASSSSMALGTHYALPFNNASYSDNTRPPEFGNSADPATSYTTSDDNAHRAADLVHCMWYVHDAITIDAVVGIEGADNATGDSTNMHLFSYDFTSGATNCLTNGTLLAHNSTVTNAGCEQPYLSTFTIDSANVASEKIIIAFFEPVTINSDYSISMQIKYHIQ